MEGLTLDQLDHEFIGRGDPNVEAIRLQTQYEQNLTPEELQRMRQLGPAVEEFFILDYKGKTGKAPEGQREVPIDKVPPEEQMDIDEYARQQGVPEDEIEGVMSEIYGPKEGMPSNINGELPPSMPSASPKQNPIRQEVALGTEDLQQEQVQGMPPVQEVLPGAQSGLVQDPQDPNASPVGDTVPMDNVQEGTAVINEAAVRIVGLKDLMKARDEAREILRAQGKIIDDEKDSSVEGVDIAVANGEFMFTKDEVGIIGEETINKWNKKGEAETEQAIANEQPQQSQQPQQLEMPPIMGAKKGIIVGGGGLTGQEQYVEDMQEKVSILDEQAADTDPNIDVIHKPQFPAETLTDEKIYQYPKEKVKSAIAQHEWKNQEPKYGFVGLTRGMESSAYGPGQIIGTTMKDMIDRNVFGKGELKNYAEKINAAQTLFFNYWANEMKMDGADTDLGKAALKKLGINREQFKKYVDEGYFTPSNRKNAQERNIPQELLGQNSDRNYDFLWDAVIKDKTKRGTVSGIDTFLTDYHGGSKDDNSRYVKAIRDILDQKE